MEFRELTDEQWKFIEPMLPLRAREGRPRADDRTTINGILYVLTTGSRWMDLPEKYGDDVTAWRRLKNWADAGVWNGILKQVVSVGYTSGSLILNRVSIDSTDVAAKKGGRSLDLTVTRGSRERRSMHS